jgi:tRNA-splicing ligase RtcB
MPVLQEINEGRVPVKIYTDEIESSARQQLINIAQLPCVFHHVAAMPDVHAGIGATVGSVIATDKAIIPAAVGVDIGCGMMATQLSLSANDLDERTLKRAYDQISRDVPVGRDQHRPERAATEAAAPFEKDLQAILTRHPELKKRLGKATNWVYQLGTLGGGNHFIELCVDEAQHIWAMVHSGSRGIGNAIGTHFIALARGDMERISIHLPDRDLAYFEEGTRHLNDYVEAVDWAQRYSMRNREVMMERILAALARHLPPFKVVDTAVNCHHNYVQRERHFGSDVWITRKGAIRAGAGELGIIPGSMGAKSYIVRGKGARDSFESCAHGAGRRMSRTEAKRRFTTKDLSAQTEGIICRKDAAVVDEIPGAYKDIDTVMAQQSDLVEVVHTLKQLLCIKG